MNRGPKSLGKRGTFDGLARRVALTYGMALGDTRAMLGALFAAIGADVRESERLSIPGFGVFYAKRHKRRPVKAPPGAENAGELMMLPAQVTIGFRAARSQRKVRGRSA